MLQSTALFIVNLGTFMDALSLLTSRRSNKKLGFPTPNKHQLEQIFQAALHTPDHGKLQPYSFFVFENQGLEKLRSCLKQTVTEFQLDDRAAQKAENLANSPMIIAVVAKIQPHIEKVPAWEQMLTAGCAAYAIQLATNALGFDNVWLSGKWVNGSALRQLCGCQEQDKIVALLKIGTAENELEREAKKQELDPFVHYL